MAELAGVSVEEIKNNKTAITMIMHYYKVLSEENKSLKNERNTLQTYVQGYERKKTYTLIGAILLLMSNVGIGFGVNLMTSNQIPAGVAALIPALALAISGTYFSFKDAN